VALPLLSEYLADRKRTGLSASSIKLIVVALRSSSGFWPVEARLRAILPKRLRSHRIERYLPETLNELQVEQFLEKIDTKVSHGLRDRAMIELLYASGLRISELANARLENFNFEERMVRVTGKGNKTRIVRWAAKLAKRWQRISLQNGRNWSSAAAAVRFFFRNAARN